MASKNTKMLAIEREVLRSKSIKFVKRVSAKTCEVCQGAMRVLSETQFVRFCSKKCRKKRLLNKP